MLVNHKLQKILFLAIIFTLNVSGCDNSSDFNNDTGDTKTSAGVAIPPAIKAKALALPSNGTLTAEILIDDSKTGTKKTVDLAANDVTFTVTVQAGSHDFTVLFIYYDPVFGYWELARGTSTVNVSGGSTTNATIPAYSYQDSDSDGVSNLDELIARTNPGDEVAFYPFNGNANDETGYGNDGVVNGATLTADKNNNPNSAYSVFRNTTVGDITVPDSNSLDLQNFTLMTWFNMNAVTDAFSVLIGKDYTTAYAIGIDSGGSGTCPAPAGVARQMRVYVGGNVYYFSASDFACNTWYHVAITYDDTTGDVQLFVNGILADTGNVASGSIAANTYDLGIGKDGRYGDHFNGVIDEARIYNRVLSASEIYALYFK